MRSGLHHGAGRLADLERRRIYVSGRTIRLPVHPEERPAKLIQILRLIAKPRQKTTNWKHYNQALINRGSLTFWIDEESVQLWKPSRGAMEDFVCLVA